MIELLAGSVASSPATSTAPIPPPHHVTLTWMALGILVASVLTWLIFRWRGARNMRRQNSPQRLWRDLARLHQLRWSDRRLLTHLARRLKLRDPARLFVEPELWRDFAVQEHSSSSRQQHIAALQAKILTA